MTPPVWVDEQGRPREQRPCPRCGRAIPVLTLPPDLLRFYGWQPWQPRSVVERCGHQIEGIPLPTVDGRWHLLVVEGEAR